MESGAAYSTVLNQLQLDVPFLHSLKTSENQWYKNGTLSNDGLIAEGHFAIFETFALYQLIIINFLFQNSTPLFLWQNLIQLIYRMIRKVNQFLKSDVTSEFMSISNYGLDNCILYLMLKIRFFRKLLRYKLFNKQELCN